MSSNSPQPPDLDRIEKDFKTIAGLPAVLSAFIRDVAIWIRRRQCVELSTLFVVILLLVLFSKAAVDKYLSNASPYVYFVWAAIGLIFALNIFFELRKKLPLRHKAQDLGRRKAIKFLSSFEQEDAEIFSLLQGHAHRNLDDISENIIRPEFAFGVLKGKSGCGKSSYLKARLLAALAKTEVYRGVYIKFSNLDTVVTIREAFVAALRVSKAEVEGLGVIELLNKGIEVAAKDSPQFKSLILIFDQFEQFFVYTDDAERRSAFIEALADWYRDDALKMKVKILVAIREDWFARMDEIQGVLGYTLRVGSQSGGNSFYLRNFSAEEATGILEVIAQEDLGIEAEDTVRFDRTYMQEVLERELADPTDHLISPIDLQILAETIKQQNVTEMRSFNRTALQRLGGIEGLRRSFLESILEPLGAEQQKSAVKLLVALTNLEQQTRAGVQTLERLQEKLKGAVPTHEVVKIADELQKAALIAVVERDGVKGYELSHEGMIGAVIRLGEKVQDKVYRANQLLERRVNEWLGNNCKTRYLFNLRELWSLEQQKPYLLWGVKRQQKVKLIAKSKQRYYKIFGGAGGIFLLIIGGWFWLNFTTLGQLTQIRWELTSVSQQTRNPQYQSLAVQAFAKDENFEQAFKIVNQIQEPSDKVSALSSIAEASVKLNQPKLTSDLLHKAIESAKQIQKPYSNAIALISIAKANVKLNQPKQAADLLNEALTFTYQKEPSFNDTELGSIASDNIAFGNIVQVYIKLNQPKQSADLLDKAIESANKLPDSSFLDSSRKASALMSIVEAFVKLNQPKQAADLLNKALGSTNLIVDSFVKTNIISCIAEASFKLNQPKQAADFLNKALESANKQDSYYYKAIAISSIAKVYVKLNQPKLAADLLNKALESANQIQQYTPYPYSKVSALSSIAEAYITLNQPDQAVGLLNKVLDFANKQDSYLKDTTALSSIAEVSAKLNQPKQAADLLNKILDSASQIQDSSDKASALSSVAEANAKIGDWGQALAITQQCPSKNCEVESLAKVLIVYAEQQYPELKKEKKE
jgi:tetratricopeptide (TPR) repeat protein